MCAYLTTGNTPSLVTSNSQPPTATSQQSTEHTPGTDGHKGGEVSTSLLG